jgi:hypothetical protein
MTDTQHPPEALCGPEELLQQVRKCAHKLGLQIAGVCPFGLLHLSAICFPRHICVQLATVIVTLRAFPDRQHHVNGHVTKVHKLQGRTRCRA